MAHDAEQILAWIGLSSIPGVGRATFRKLAGRFGSPAGVLSAPESELSGTGGAPPRISRAIAAFPWRESAERELARADAAGVAIITEADPAYPAALRRAADAPLFLYVSGTLLPQDHAAVAVVGTRTPTHYGLTVTHRMAYELAAAGLTVVSGMARGIDTQAHKGALDAGGRTIAVLGCGIDVVYPPENRNLRERIAASGAVVTENPFGTRPESGYFPARNRIISGLAAGTVIVEASTDSGSLITADYALKQGRKLFAVPGNVGSPVSRGTNSLIRQGAVLVESAADVLRGLDSAPPPAATPDPAGASRRPLPKMTGDEAAVLKAITAEPKHIDALLAECGITAGRLGGILTALELYGAVKQLPGKLFVREEE
jgi:DNA processing protein